MTPPRGWLEDGTAEEENKSDDASEPSEPEAEYNREHPRPEASGVPNDGEGSEQPKRTRAVGQGGTRPHGHSLGDCDVARLLGRPLGKGTPRRAGREEAFEAIKFAASRLDDAAGRNAVKQFRSNIPWLGNDPRLAGIEKMEAKFPLWPNLRKRNENYERLRAAVNRSEDGTATEAAEAFLKIGPEEEDPRRYQVEPHPFRITVRITGTSQTPLAGRGLLTVGRSKKEKPVF